MIKYNIIVCYDKMLVNVAVYIIPGCLCVCVCVGGCVCRCVFGWGKLI